MDAEASDATIQRLIDALGPDAVIADPDRTASYATDWTGRYAGRPAAVVRPGDADGVAEVVTVCRERGHPLVPQGGNTGLVGGATPMRGEIVLSTERLSDISAVDEDAGQLTAGAGVRIAEVQQMAGEAGWRYGVDLASRDTATVGGTVATNAGGLRVLRFGPTRHQVLGVEAVLGTGDVVRRLGGLAKDNTGYDLAGLLCGSEGTLGIVTQARLALVPAAGEAVTALIGFDDVVRAVRGVGAIRRAVPTLEAAELVLASGAGLVAEQTGEGSVLESDPPVLVLVEAVGPPDPTDRLGAVIGSLDGAGEVAVATDPSRAAALWHVREAHTEAISRIGVPRKYDVTLPGRALASYVDTIAEEVVAVVPDARTWLFGHVADGNIHVNVTGVDPTDGEAVDRVVLGGVVRREGSISAEHGIGLAKRRWLADDRGAGDLAAMRAIRTALDPDGILNPNVLLP
ncbi:MAG: FAD-binding oxidoreductase [Acidimicrobiales bacterium]|nr:FAD-binding oxidoreductase [Acidimicrobiales bacterium]